MESYNGWPILTAENCFSKIRESGIVPWIEDPQYGSAEEYFEGALSHEEFIKRMNNFNKFAPKTTVSRYKNPNGNKEIDGFKTTFTPYAMVFALIDDYVPVTAEWKHGNSLITIVPPAGAPTPDELRFNTLTGAMRLAAMREWKEETGTHLSYCVPLSPENGHWANVRTTQTQCFLFAGEVREGGCASQNLDASEDLKMFLFPLAEWLKLMTIPDLWNENPDFGLEAVVPTLTFLALYRLGKLNLS